MSDYWSMYHDAMFEQYIEELAHEASMEIITIQQCIYLFVEGRTEEEAFPELLARCDIDLETLGIVIANYRGISSLLPCLRLLKQTLSHDRPVIVTLDNDEEGNSFIGRFGSSGVDADQLRIVPLPSIITPIKYSDGHCGGSFEELFSVEHFLDQVFSPDFLPENVVVAKEEFLKAFKNDKNWFGQAKKFCAERGHVNLKDMKVELGIRLAETCPKVPPDILKLAQIIRELRDKHPIRDPNMAAMESVLKRKDLKK